jgi:hypothetical protein
VSIQGSCCQTLISLKAKSTIVMVVPCSLYGPVTIKCFIKICDKGDNNYDNDRVNSIFGCFFFSKSFKKTVRVYFKLEG